MTHPKLHKSVWAQDVVIYGLAILSKQKKRF